MSGKKTRLAKKCKVCSKGLRIQNKSGLCSHHYMMDYNKKLRKKRKKKHLCIICGKKIALTTKSYTHNSNIKIKIYKVRCNICLERARISSNNYNKNPNIKERNKTYRNLPYVKIKRKAYENRLDVKERRKIYQREYYQLNKKRIIKYQNKYKVKQKTKSVTTL